MVTSRSRRRELGDLLRSRRGQLDAAELGLPEGARRRSPGLRREEVAALSGVSVTWYTWLEQGRDTRPSRQVLDALARTLRLSGTEHAYVLSLAGYAPALPRDGHVPASVPGHVQRLLDAQVGLPSFALAHDWQIVAWNESYAALYPGVETVNASNRNLLWLVFTDPYVRQLLPNWRQDSRRFLAQFRAETGPRLEDPGVAALIHRLCTQSADFADGWRDHDIQGFSSRERLFHHPSSGDLLLEHHQLVLADQPNLHIVIYLPVDDGYTPQRWSKIVHAHQR